MVGTQHFDRGHDAVNTYVCVCMVHRGGEKIHSVHYVQCYIVYTCRFDAVVLSTFAAVHHCAVSLQQRLCQPLHVEWQTAPRPPAEKQSKRLAFYGSLFE